MRTRSVPAIGRGLRPAALLLLLAATAPAPADDPPLPKSIERFRRAVEAWNHAPEAAREWQAEFEFGNALDALEGEPDPRVVECLLDAMDAKPACRGHHGEFGTHYTARKIAGKRPREDLARFMSAAVSRGRAARAMVLGLIEEWKAVEGLDFIRRCLAPGEEGIPFRSVSTLAALPGEGAETILRSFLTDTREAVFQDYPKTYPRWDRLPKSVPYKYSTLHPLWVILRPGCISLGGIADWSYAEIRSGVGAHALVALADRGAEVSIGELQKMLDSDSLRLQQAAARAIAEMHPRELAARLKKEWKSPYMRGLCADLRAAAGDGEAVDDLIRMTESRDALFRVYAVQALADAPGEKAADRLRALARSPDTFVVQSALNGLIARRDTVDPELIAEAMLSWDSWVSDRAEEMSERLGPGERRRVAMALLARAPSAPPPKGPYPVDPETEGGEVEPSMTGQSFEGDSMTVSTRGSAESPVGRVQRFWKLAEGLRDTELRRRGRAILTEIGGANPEQGPAEDARRALATAAIALAPVAEDFDDLVRWAKSSSPAEAIAGVRGIAVLGDTRGLPVLLDTFERARTERKGTGWNPLYAEGVGALAEIGTDEAWKRFESLAPWVLHPGKTSLQYYEDTEDVSSFVEGATRGRSPRHADLLARLEEWLASAGDDYSIEYEVIPRFWKSLYHHDSAAADSLLEARLLKPRRAGDTSPLRWCVHLLGSELLDRLKRRTEETKWEDGLEYLDERDHRWALDVARRRLSESAAAGEAPSGTAAGILLDEGDPRDRDLLVKAIPDPSVLPEYQQRQLRRLLKRTG